jgi:hypothetical protein
MAPLLKELSSLEVEPLEIVEHAPESEQDRSLNTLTTTSGDLDVEALFTGKGTSPVAEACCCCSIPCCLCCLG